MIGASNASILSTLEPVITVFLAALLLSEKINAMQLVGGGFILTSVILLHLPMRRRLTQAALNA
jgi:drug/metabolite transporter (DMT)-like permease